MKPSELSGLLATMLEVKLPVLIKGAPGVGKSDIVAQAAQQLEADLVIMHPVVSDPTDFKGLPALVKGQAEFLPFGDLRRLIDATKPTIAFLDDLGQAPAVVQAAAMQLILARQVNGHKVSDHVVFVAATNRREDRAGVTGILEPVKSRFASIIELAPDVDDWCGWALDNGMPVELVAFIRFRPELLMAKGAPTNDIVNRPCPRTVAFVGHLYNAGIRSIEVFAGAAGEAFADEWVGFLRIWEALPSIDGILMDPKGSPVPTEPAALYAVTAALVEKVTAQNGGRIIEYARRLPIEYATLLIRDCLRRCPGIANTRTFIAWATEHADALM